MTMDRIEAITIVDRLVNQAVIISHSIAEGGDIYRHHIEKRLKNVTSLDKQNSQIRRRIVEVFREEFNIDLDLAEHWRY